jgi:ribosomal protein S18 acetylase RimI-like enzyme
MSLDVVVRAYEARDRAAVRDICFETGDAGDPVDWLWPDRESWADMFSGYYTDCEPRSASVVEVDGFVRGYLLGAVDADAARNPATVAAHHIVHRGIAFRAGTRRFIARAVADSIGDIASRRVSVKELDFHDSRWPAHLHIDLLPVARGRGAGRQLVQRWFDQLRALGITGCHLQTMSHNDNAIAFFRAVGFRTFRDTQLVPGFRTRAGDRVRVQTMVREL